MLVSIQHLQIESVVKISVSIFEYGAPNISNCTVIGISITIQLYMYVGEEKVFPLTSYVQWLGHVN